MVLFKKSAKKQHSTSRFSIATWNVSELSAKEKKEQLGRDCSAYVLDLVCVQETKVPEYDEINLSSGHKLILMQQKTAKYCGLGFVIGPRLIPHIRSWWYPIYFGGLVVLRAIRQYFFCQNLCNRMVFRLTSLVAPGQ